MKAPDFYAAGVQRQAALGSRVLQSFIAHCFGRVSSFFEVEFVYDQGRRRR